MSQEGSAARPLRAAAGLWVGSLGMLIAFIGSVAMHGPTAVWAAFLVLMIALGVAGIAAAMIFKNRAQAALRATVNAIDGPRSPRR